MKPYCWIHFSRNLSFLLNISFSSSVIRVPSGEIFSFGKHNRKTWAIYYPHLFLELWRSRRTIPPLAHPFCSLRLFPFFFQLRISFCSANGNYSSVPNPTLCGILFFLSIALALSYPTESPDRPLAPFWLDSLKLIATTGKEAKKSYITIHPLLSPLPESLND